MRCWTKDDSIADDHAFLAEGKVTLTDVGFMFADVPDVSAVALAAGLRLARTKSPAGAGAEEEAAFERAANFAECTGFSPILEFGDRVQCQAMPSLHVAVRSEGAKVKGIPGRTACFPMWSVKHPGLPVSLESVRRTAIAE